MNALVCEMCGGVDLVKDGGVFVCQHCGCKYSVEEARKIMVEGTVNVAGVVGIDRSNEARLMLKNADGMFFDGNYAGAYALYSDVLNRVPDNAYGTLMRGVCAGMLGNAKRERFTELNRATKRALSLKHASEGDSRAYFEFCDLALKRVHDVVAVSFDYYARHRELLMDSVKSSTHIRVSSVGGFVGSVAGSAIGIGMAKQKIDVMTKSGVKNWDTVMANVMTYAFGNVEDFGAVDKDFWVCMMVLVMDILSRGSAFGLSEDEMSCKQACEYVEMLAGKWKQELIEAEERYAYEVARNERIEELRFRAEQCRRAIGFVEKGLVDLNRRQDSGDVSDDVDEEIRVRQIRKQSLERELLSVLGEIEELERS